ncbi:MAG: helix-turn-helix transcriptional regulator [Hylemonella sp.]|nr:helix-turn-helix transcriptional regulator [Hylemonella sp.]
MPYPHSDLAHLSETIGLIYEGSTDPSRWGTHILPAMCDYVQAPGCFLFTPLHTPQSGGYAFTHGIGQEFLDLYVNKYQHMDIWTLAAMERNLLTEGTIAIGEDHVSREELLASEFYRNCLSVEPNAGQLLGSVVFDASSQGAIPSACSYIRPLDGPRFGEVERQRQQLLLPHLSRALGVMQRLRTAELTLATTLASLNRLSSGILLLDPRGHVAFANAVAEDILAQGGGLRLRRHAGDSSLGQIDAGGAALQRAVNAAIESALQRDPYNTAHFSRSVLIPRPDGMGSYVLQFSALGDQNEFGGGMSGFSAIAFISDSTQRPQIDPAVLRSTYGLTAAEASVAITLLEHDSAKSAAQVLGVSPDTVRSQIRQIYAKLGVDTRTRFVKTVLGLANRQP